MVGDPAEVQARADSLLAAGDPDGAVDVLDRAVRAMARPHPVLAINLGRLLWPRGAVERATGLLEAATAAAPGEAAGWLNLGDARAAADDPRAETAYRRAIALRPDLPSLHWSLATDLLVHGRPMRAWPHFLWRHRDPAVRARPSPYLRLESRDRPPARLLLWSNEGIGEDLRYAGLLPALARRGIAAVVEADPRLVPLLGRSFPGLDVVARAWPPAPAAAAPAIGAQATLADLWPLLAPDGPPPVAAAYLRPGPQTATLRARYRGLGEGPLVGVSWRSVRTPFAAAKSISPADLAPLLARPAVFVSLQHGEAGTAAGDGLHRDASIDPLVDLDAFAAQVAAMDLVITTSSTTAHMAGALGVPTWVALHRGPPITPYWRAGRDAVDWYPSMRVWRQATPGRWDDVLRAIGDALDHWLAGRTR
ncbi:MAG: tetratricopeptide repeat protein [Alphaproteobacteria bacterium]